MESSFNYTKTAVTHTLKDEAVGRQNDSLPSNSFATLRRLGWYPVVFHSSKILELECSQVNRLYHDGAFRINIYSLVH